jgi:tetratricopeptide (TPR) repeat protein
MTRSESILDARYYPPAGDPCPCGSRDRFGKCCYETLSQSIDLESEIAKAHSEKKYTALLALRRATVCRYVLWHRAHTVPLMKRNAVGDLLMIDVRALSDYVEQLIRAYDLAGVPSLCRAALVRLERAIDDERWRKRICYLSGLASLILYNDRHAAREQLKDLGDWTTSEDADVLQFGIDVDDSMTQGERTKVVQRILVLEPSSDNKIQYNTVLAMLAYSNGDVESASGILRRLIDGHSAEAHGLNARAKVLFAGSIIAYTEIEQLADRSSLLELARVLLRSAEEAAAYTPEGLSMLNDQIAESYESEGDAARAMEFYVKAIDEADGVFPRMGLTRLSLEQEDLVGALRHLDALEAMDLSDANKYDVLLLKGTLALASEDVTMARSVLRRLEDFGSLPPVLSLRKEDLDRRLHALIAAGRLPLEASGQSAWRAFLSTINKYLHLRPTLFGLGINVNEILSTVEATVERRRGSRRR